MHKLLKIAIKFEHKLAQKQPGAYYSPKGEKARPGKFQMGETTIIGDPKAEPETPEITPESIAQRLTLPEPLAFYNPGEYKAKEMLAKLPGYQYIANIGLVPSDKINIVKQKLNQGWQYAGAGYGLVHKDYFEYLKQYKYV